MSRDIHYAYDARHAEPDYLEDGPEEVCEICEQVGCVTSHTFYADEPFEPKCWGGQMHQNHECLHFDREEEVDLESYAMSRAVRA